MATPEHADQAQQDWSGRTADTIESVVGTIREKTVGPLVKATRAVVYGILALVALITIGILSTVALIRILDVYAFGGRVWISYFLIGGILTVLGLLLWTKRKIRP